MFRSLIQRKFHSASQQSQVNQAPVQLAPVSLRRRNCNLDMCNLRRMALLESWKRFDVVPHGHHFEHDALDITSSS